jgi:hypothetical protein
MKLGSNFVPLCLCGENLENSLNLLAALASCLDSLGEPNFGAGLTQMG